MAKRFYEPFETATKLRLYIDPDEFSVTTDTEELADIVEVQGLSDDLRLELGAFRGFASLGDFDTALEDQEYEIRDRLDYYTAYLTRVEAITVADGAWFSPEAVESFCGEDVGDEAVDAIDGNTGTFWRHSEDHLHNAVYRLRAYPKRIEKVRFFYGAGESARERLNDLTIRCARNLNNIDEPGNIIESGLALVWPTPGGVWVEHTLAESKQQCRYIKIETDNTDNGANTIQVREFEVWVGTRAP